jgi:hypothetical protein
MLAAQLHTWFQQGMYWQIIFGGMFAAGYELLVWYLLSIGKHEMRPE